MELFEEIAMNNYQWYSSRAKSGKTTHFYDVDIVTTLIVQVENLNKKIDELMVTKWWTPVSHSDLCGGSHGS